MITTKLYNNTDIKVQYTSRHGHDYSFNGVYTIKKKLEKNGINKTPAVIGKEIISQLSSSFYTVKFDRNCLFFVIQPKYVATQVIKLLSDNILQQTSDKGKVMVEFSSPNIAKEMHVGHLRSTIIGDVLHRLFRMTGHDTHGISHIGDTGVQFGSLIQCLYEKFSKWREKDISISSMQDFYVLAKKCMENDEFKLKASKRVLELQNNNKDIIEPWKYIKDVSKKAYFKIYNRLNINIEEVGESFYLPMIPNMIKELETKKMITIEDGRKIIVVPNFKLPLTIVKSDGGYTYDTTDLAAIRYRLVTLNLKKIYYVVDTGQSIHFGLIFAVARSMGWLKDEDVRHINFGIVKGKNGKRLKSRSGGIIKLKDLLDESITKATTVLKSKRDDLSKEEENNIIKSVAMGAIKYADLSVDRTRDYIFSYDKMLSLKGNTAPYLLYAYTRISSIIRKSKNHYQIALSKKDNFTLLHPEEIKICKYLMLYLDIISKVLQTLCPHYLCIYIYKLSTMFHVFFTKCRCIYYEMDKTTIKHVHYDRLLICGMVRNVMKTSFDILNIKTLDKM
jgi:arginyl-tRNA synthetase